MDTVYISGKITGTNDYMERFDAAEQLLRREGFNVINPARVSSALPPMGYGDYIKLDLVLLGFCSRIYMLDGWEDSTGARLEFQYAKALGCKILYEKYIKD